MVDQGKICYARVFVVVTFHCPRISMYKCAAVELYVPKRYFEILSNAYKEETGRLRHKWWI